MNGRLNRVPGPLLIVIGILHLSAGFFFYWQPLVDIAAAGFANAVEPDLSASLYDREAAFWYMIAGYGLIMLGLLMRWAQARAGTLPESLGWMLLAVGAIGVLLMPVSGFWLILALGVLTIAVSRKEGTAPPAPASKKTSARQA